MEELMEEILITGGAGFIGSHLCEALSGFSKVISLDNYSSGSKDNHVKNVEYIDGDTRDIESIFKERDVPSTIFHLGEYSRVEQSFDNIEKVLEYNKIGTLAVLEFCRKYNIKLIYAGSSTKYGDIGSNSSPYAWSKASNTDLVNNYGEWFDLDYAITYFYNVYGPREVSEGSYATLIAKYLKLYKEGMPLPVVLPGTQKRNFTHINDIIHGLLYVAEYGEGDGYGIGSEESFSVIEVTKMFPSNISMLPKRKGNRMSAGVVTDKTKALGWEAKYSLKQYISERIKEIDRENEA